eukprot:scaffold1733_cov123-Isochrysis_galbana.AAC.2
MRRGGAQEVHDGHVLSYEGTKYARQGPTSTAPVCDGRRLYMRTRCWPFLLIHRNLCELDEAFILYSRFSSLCVALCSWVLGAACAPL